MTDDEALAEARRRWGEDAKVRHDAGPRRLMGRPYAVGYRHKSVFYVCGEGDSWEEAFQEAGRRPPGAGGPCASSPFPKLS
jgi:hypothetical protein